VSNAEGLKGKYTASRKFLGGRYQLESSVEVVWICSGARCFHFLLVLLVVFAISIFLYRAKCEGRCAKKQWSGDHVC